MNKNYIEKMRNHLNGESIRIKYDVLIHDAGHTNEEIKEIYPEIKMFSDLKFGKHRVDPKAIQGVINFDNGHFVSVVGGIPGFYGDGKTSFEVGFPDKAGGIAVKGWLSPEEVTEVMVDIQSKSKMKK
jgi:hypothetical protein